MALKRFFNIDAPPPPSQPEGLSQRLVQDLARSTRYDAASIEGLGELFFNFADSTGMLDKTRFIERLGLINSRKLLFAERLYEAFLRGRREGKLNFSDFVIGLNAMTRADQEERTKFCFKLYDISNSDSVSRANLRAMTESTVECALTLAEMAATILAARNSVATRVELDTKLHGRGEVLSTHKTEAPHVEVRHGAKRLTSFPPEEAIQKTVDKIFEEIDQNRDGKISLREFKTWVSRDPGALDVLTFYAKMLTSVDQVSAITQKV